MGTSSHEGFFKDTREIKAQYKSLAPGQRDIRYPGYLYQAHVIGRQI